MDTNQFLTGNFLKFPTPPADLINPMERFTFGNAYNKGGTSIYITSALHSFSITLFKFLTLTKIITQQEGTQSLLIYPITSNYNVNDKVINKYAKVSFTPRLDKTNDKPRIILVQNVYKTDMVEKEQEYGIIINLEDFLKIEQYIYTPGKQAFEASNEIADF